MLVAFVAEPEHDRKERPLSDSEIVTNRYLDGSYLERNPDWHEADAPWKAQQVLRMLERRSLAPASVCDLGCGSGGVLDALRRQLPEGTEFVGYEPSPEASAIASTREGLRIVTGDASSVAEHFGLILALDVMEHVEDYLGFLKQLKGRADFYIFHIPLDLSVQTVLRMTPLILGRESVGHLHYFSYETALATLTYAGYTIVDEFYTPGGLELPRLGPKQRLAAIPRGALFRANQRMAVRLLGGFSLLVLATAESAAPTGHQT